MKSKKYKYNSLSSVFGENYIDYSLWKNMNLSHEYVELIEYLERQDQYGKRKIVIDMIILINTLVLDDGIIDE